MTEGTSKCPVCGQSGLIEAAEWHEQQAKACLLSASRGVRAKSTFHKSSAQALRARAADRSSHSLSLSEAEKKQQAMRCSCRGYDDYCVCQNVPDRETIRARAADRSGKL